MLFWGQENQQMLLTLALCLLVATILSAAVVVFLLRNRYIARQKLKDLTQSADSEAPRDYQVTNESSFVHHNPIRAALRLRRTKMIDNAFSFHKLALMGV